MTKSGDLWTMSGAGYDIWGNSDGMRFAWKEITGNVTITAKVESLVGEAGLNDIHVWVKVGVMIRESNDAN